MEQSTFNSDVLETETMSPSSPADDADKGISDKLAAIANCRIIESEITTREPPSPSGEDAEGKDDDTFSSLGVDSILPKKKKKKSKPKSKRGLNAPTGFEEYYVDTPLTPGEYAEEQELYSKEFPFIERILTAIQRFERTRRLIPVRRDVFYKYLAYGSIDVGPNMFQSLDVKAAKDLHMGKTELAAAMTQASIASDKHDLDSPTSLYAVDFTGCISGFLSRRASDWFGMETQDGVELVTTTLERFMAYLLQHDVCPEYAADVLNARNICRRATKELWAVAQAQRWLPGDFNIACSTLFNGQYARDYDGVRNWAGTVDGEATFVGFTQETANQIMSFGIAGAAYEDVYLDFLRRVEEDSFDVVEVKEMAGFEITGIEGPSKDCRDLYKDSSQDFRPVGRVFAKAWTNPEAPPEDLTAEEREALRTLSPTSNKQDNTDYTFLIEEAIQQHLFVGMKVEATIRKLNCGRGLWFLDELLRCYCSFDVYLCNEKMMGWKKPQPVPGALHYQVHADDVDGGDDAGDQIEAIQATISDVATDEVDAVAQREVDEHEF